MTARTPAFALHVRSAVLVAILVAGLVAGLGVALSACGPAAPESAPVTTPAPAPIGEASSATARKDPDDQGLPRLSSVERDPRNAIAWAPLDDPDDLTVEGSVPSSRAWSTSKPLIVAAYLDTVAHGDPAVIPADHEQWIRAALSESDGEAIIALGREIPGSPGAAMTRILRSIGDTTTIAPDAFAGTMRWSVGEQVRFMAALANGRVVSAAASAFLLQQMQPIAAHRWGLGGIGASAFKPGWYRADTETRQMGIVGGHAVAIITAGDGPAVRQSDGDYAHVQQLDRLADLLARRLGEA